MFKWILLLALSLVAFGFIVGYVLPKKFLKNVFVKIEPADRGVKKIDERNGFSIVYEPEMKIKRFIKQYILSERSANKVLVCKLSEDVRMIDFDVAVFNAEDQIVSVLNVALNGIEKNITDEINLPDETAYVSILINDVNGRKTKNKVLDAIPKRNLSLMILLSSLAILIEVPIVKWCIANLFGGVFRESFMITGFSVLQTAIVIVGCIAVNVIASVCIVATKNKKLRKEGK